MEGKSEQGETQDQGASHAFQPDRKTTKESRTERLFPCSPPVHTPLPAWERQLTLKSSPWILLAAPGAGLGVQTAAAKAELSGGSAFPRL